MKTSDDYIIEVEDSSKVPLTYYNWSDGKYFKW